MKTCFSHTTVVWKYITFCFSSSVAVQGEVYKHLVLLLQMEDGAQSHGLPSLTKGEKTSVIFVSTLRGDAVSMLTHTCPHTTPGEDQSGHLQAPGWRPILSRSDICSGDLQATKIVWPSMTPNVPRPSVIKQHAHTLKQNACWHLYMSTLLNSIIMICGTNLLKCLRVC